MIVANVNFVALTRDFLGLKIVLRVTCVDVNYSHETALSNRGSGKIKLIYTVERVLG